jgi:polyhydroxyalkanoate synthesis regulator phasin
MIQVAAMGKRGPKPKGPYGHKTGRSEVTSVRLQPDTKADLIAAKQAKNRPGRPWSLAQEIEHRLRLARREDRTIREVFGDDQTYGLMVLAARAILSLNNLRKPKLHWTADPYLFDQAIRTMESVLKMYRPEGEPSADSLRSEQGLGLMQYKHVVGDLVQELRDVDPASDKLSDDQRELIRIRDRLGELAGRADLRENERKLQQLERRIAPLLHKKVRGTPLNDDENLWPPEKAAPRGEPLNEAEEFELRQLFRQRDELEMALRAEQEKLRGGEKILTADPDHPDRPPRRRRAK